VNQRKREKRSAFGAYFHGITYQQQEWTMGNVPLEPLAALAAGILVLVQPKILNYVVAAYLIVIGGSGVMKSLR